MWPPTVHGVSSNNNMKEQSVETASYNYNGDMSYNSSNHQPSPPQMPSYQPFHQASGWNMQSTSPQTFTSPPMYDGIGPSSHGFNGNVGHSYNDRRVDRSSFSNQGPGQMHQSQGLWNPHDASSKPLPSPVFNNVLSSPQPRTWLHHERGGYNNYRGRGFVNSPNHQLAQRLTTPMEGYQPMQFTPPKHRPRFSGPRGRGGFTPNQSGGRGSRGHARGGNGNGAGPGRGRGRNNPAKSNGKSQEGKFVCDPCERCFNNEEQLGQHISEHRTCGIDGCKLTAHTSVVDKHVKMQHDTGLFLKMKDMVNSDDFAKWRAERKMRYPSKENIAKRQAEQDEKKKRGETIGSENGRFPRNRGGNAKRGQRRERGGRGRNLRERMNAHALGEPQDNAALKNFLDAKKEDQGSQLSKVVHGKKPFSHTIDEEQIQDSLPKEERAFSDTEWEAAPETGDGKSAAGVPQLSAALNVLASMYDSDSSSGNEADGSKALAVKVKTEVAAQNGDALGEDGDLPMEEPIIRVAPEKEEVADAERPRNASHKRSNPRHPRTEERSKRRKANHGDQHTRSFTRKPDVTLLQKLLASEIRHERNVVLQCIRYIVENNFLAVTNQEKAENTELTPACGQNTALCDSELNQSSTILVPEPQEGNVV